MHDFSTGNLENKLNDEFNFDEFPAGDYQTWKKEVEEILKGEDFEKKLTTSTYENIRLDPMYWPDDLTGLGLRSVFPGFPPFTRSSRRLGYAKESWQITPKFPYPTPRQFNEALLIDLPKGQTSISLKLDKASKRCIDPDRAEIGEVGRNGTSIATADDFETLFKGNDLAGKTIHLKTGASALPQAALLFGYFKKANVIRNSISCHFKADPIGELAAIGELPISLASAFDEMALLAAWAVGKNLNLKTIAVDSSAYHNSGASAVEELAFAMATGLEYIREMMNRNSAINDIACQMTFIFSMGPRFFTEIAKLRAARLLWSSVVAACGGDELAQKMTIHAKTSYYDKTSLEPHVNMLRGTTEAFSAIISGCDSLHVGYYDEAIRQPDEFSRRFSRNVQLILKEESHFDKVIDPAGGSWYVEALTNQLARRAWKLFQDIEAEGGMVESLKKGIVQKRIETVAGMRQENIARQRDVFVGATMYANSTEKQPEKQAPDYKMIHSDRIEDLAAFSKRTDNNKKTLALENLFQAAASPSMDLMEKAIEAAASGATLGDIAKAIRKDEVPGFKIYPLKIQRGAEIFEVLRQTIESAGRKSEKPLRVFLACVGRLSDYKPREEFAMSFFQTGGFETVSHHAEEYGDAVRAAIDSQAPITVICSSDENYRRLVTGFAKSLKQGSPEMIMVLAGEPRDNLEEYKKAGIDEFIYPGANVYETLVKLSRKIGVIS